MLAKATFLVVLVLTALFSSFVSLPPGAQVTELLNVNVGFVDLLTNNVLNGVLFGLIVGSILFLMKRDKGSSFEASSYVLDPEVEMLLNDDVIVNESSELTEIKGIGKKRACELEFAGVTSIVDLAKRSPQHLSEKTGISIAQISSWIVEANKIKKEKD